jgi:serine protease Do
MDANFNQKNQFAAIIIVSVLISSIFGFIAGGMGSGCLPGKKPAGTSQSLKESSSQALSQTVTTSQEQAVEAVVRDFSPAVVSVIATKNLTDIEKNADPFDGFFSNPFGDLFPFFQSPAPDSQPSSQDSEPQEVGGGSGFIISADGLILTNKHVVDIDGADYTVLTNDGQKYPAKILARDPIQDIAILKIEKNNLPTVKLGDSDNLQIGQSVVAIGNALGEFRNTVSVGVISGLKRSVTASDDFGFESEQLEDVIQTDAAINPGNSGGPLLNLSGEVIGINVAVAQGAQNIGFSLPINLAKKDVAQVKEKGKISYPYIGVRYVLITPSIKEKNNLSVDYGALILRGSSQDELAVVPGSPADKADLKENDIILEADGQKINNDNPLAKIVQKHNVGDVVTLKVLSKGREKTVKVALGERQ